MGRHRFRYALYPHAGGPQQGGVIPAAAAFNQPLRVFGTAAEPQAHAFLLVDNEAVVVDTVKTAEDGDDLIIRLYESHGAHQNAVLTLGRPVRKAFQVNLLEEGREAVPVGRGNKIRLALRPFEVRTLRLVR